MHRLVHPLARSSAAPVLEFFFRGAVPLAARPLPSLCLATLRGTFSTAGPTASTQPRVKSQYVGVHWHRLSRKWQAQIELKGKKNHLGYFERGRGGEGL